MCFFFRVVNGFLFPMLKLMSFILTETLLYACPTITSFFFEIILKLFIHQEQWMLHPVSLSFSFSTERPPPRSAWIKIPGNIRGPGTIGLSPRTRVLLQDFKTSRRLQDFTFIHYVRRKTWIRSLAKLSNHSDLRS